MIPLIIICYLILLFWKNSRMKKIKVKKDDEDLAPETCVKR